MISEDKGKCTCGGCGQRFRRLSGFDHHRVGPYAERSCLSLARMVELGFRKDIMGYWRSPPRARDIRRGHINPKIGWRHD